MKRSYGKFLMVLLLVFLASLFTACKGKTIKNNEDSVINWNIEASGKVALNSKKLNEMDKFISKDYVNINSVIVLKNGKLVFEKYYNDFDKDSLFELQSATKTITSALIGIAIEEAYINGIDEKVMTYFPRYVKKIKDPRFNELTIEDCLTMTDGLSWNDYTDIRKKIVQKNPIKYAFGLNFKREPGEKFNYSTLDSQILSGIISKATGMNALKFADKYLFGPLGIEERKWAKDLQGNNVGGAFLSLRTRDMAKIGQLYLNKGVWNKQQIIPRNWIDKTTVKYSEGGEPHGEKYAYHIWVTEVRGHQAYFAGGFGGQFIYVVPELELVVAITSATDMHREKHRNIIDRFIVPAIDK